VEVRIEELSLDGFAPADRLRIADAVKREIARLITERGMDQPAGRRSTVAQVDAGSFPVPPNANSEGIGKQVARTVHSTLGRAGRT
jgi:hypothetical protein